MTSLSIFLILFFILILIFNYISLSSNLNALQIVNKMGIGYNLGNSFDSYDRLKEIKNPEEQITLLGNPFPTKKMIKNIKKYGFKTIRFPITWINFIDEYGNINPEWMSRIKEVVDWIIENNMYCIINLHHDGDIDNWLYNGLKVIDKYINIWTQIANEFEDYDEYLIFESMNIPIYYKSSYDYSTLFNMTQEFVYTIRNSGGRNKERLLLISGPYAHLNYAYSSKYKIPTDPYNKLALSFHYYIPELFTTQSYEDSWFGLEYWGSNGDYNELITNFESMKKSFVDKGIPIIIGEIGVLTNGEKNISSIREYLYAVFSISVEYNGIMPCLWDTSNKTIGNMNYYNRETNEWYDEKIRNNFMEISKGKYLKLSEYYIITNIETYTDKDYFGDYFINFGKRKALKIVINATVYGKLFEDFYFDIYTADKNGVFLEIIIMKEYSKRQYDGTTIFTIDVSNLDCNESIGTLTWYGEEYFNLNSLSIEFEESFSSFNYKSYKSAIFNYIN